MLAHLALALMLAQGAKPLEIGYMAVSPHGPAIALNVSSFNSQYGEEIWVLARQAKRFRLVARKHFETGFDTLAFSPDGRFLAAGETSGSGLSDIYLFRSPSLRLIRKLHGCEDMADISFSADSRYVYGSQYGTAFKWRTSDGEKVRTWKPFGTSDINGDMFDSDSEQSSPGGIFKFIVGSYRNRMVVADRNFRTVYVGRLAKEAGISLPFTWNGAPVAFETRSDRLSGRLIELGRGANRSEAGTPSFPGLKATSVLRLSPSEKYIAGRTLDRKSIHIWPISKPAAGWTIKSDAGLMSQNFSFVNDKVLDMVNGGNLVDASSGKTLLTIEVAVPSKNHPEWIAYSPDGSFTGSTDCLKYLQPNLHQPKRTDAGILQRLRGLFSRS